jgi:aspartate aminotransferase-like enzyme
MLVDYQLLRIPGPTPVPPSVERAMLSPMIGHRNQETKDLLRRLKPGLQKVFGTNEDVMLIAGSGTAGLEIAVCNTVNPGDEVLVIVTGSFGERFAKICEAYHLQVHRIRFPNGKALQPKAIKTFLETNPTIKAVFATYCETSTGVLNPIQDLAIQIKQASDALLIVDGVSCVGAVDTKMDDWGIDILVTGSQKAFMLPPGLTLVAVSQKAWSHIYHNKQPRYYFDLRKYQQSLYHNTTPFTPPLSLLFGLEESVRLIEKEGLFTVYKRHKIMKEMIRAAFTALDLDLLTNDLDASPTVTAVKAIDFSAEELRKIAKKEFNLVLAGGQNELKGEIFRVGHMGYCSPADMLLTISLIEIALLRLGKQVELGAGVRAAQLIWIQEGLV